MMPSVIWSRASGAQSSCATSPRNRFWPLSSPSSRAAIRLMASASTPSSSRRRVRTRASRRPSAISRAAWVTLPMARVIPRSSGSQNNTDNTTAATASRTHGMGSMMSPPMFALGDSATTLRSIAPPARGLSTRAVTSSQ